CGDAVACAVGCGGDQLCEADCYLESTGLAQAQLDAIDQCATDNNCQDQQCVADNCNDELQSCIGGMSDTLPCPLIAGCLINCDGDPACEATCGRTTPEVQAEADALAECAEAEDCDNINCTQNACPEQWGACHSGEVACPDLWACIEGCNGASLCELNCVFEGTFADQVLLGGLAECIEDNQCQDQECIDSNCSAQAQACGV